MGQEGGGRDFAESDGRRGLVKKGTIIGRGWHRRAGEPHAEIEALRDAEANARTPKGATLYVTLSPRVKGSVLNGA